MKKGFYVCSCGEEFISDIPFKEARCLECGDKIEILKEIDEQEELQIKKEWSSKLQNEC